MYGPHPARPGIAAAGVLMCFASQKKSWSCKLKPTRIFDRSCAHAQYMPAGRSVLTGFTFTLGVRKQAFSGGPIEICFAGTPESQIQTPKSRERLVCEPLLCARARRP